ncbi:tetratricopeptide repeat protein [Horticoccus sp. 23ND18S-11]|uniref:tetratricopeptide repeat protein n=1 Tax=Horticoccus sp. 23ND18S-11 TaxID=3391832 RepID=UPI0039C9EDCA
MTQTGRIPPTTWLDRRVLTATLLILAVVLAYANSLRTPFLFDDAGAVVDNPTIRRLGSLDVLRPPTDGSTTTGRPIVNLSYAINYAIHGDRVLGYHLVNLGIHAANALLLLGVVRRLLAGPVLGSRLGARAAEVAFLVALLWALHPLQTESVVCIAQRTETFCAFFYLLVLYAVVRAAEAATGADSGARVRWSVLAVVASLTGMATKEVMVTVPVVAWLVDRTFLAGSFGAAWRARRWLHGALAGTWLLLAWLVTQGGGGRGVAAGFELGVSSWSYLLKQCEALVHYLQLTVWPHPLVVDYGTAVVRSAADVFWQGVLVLAGLGVTVWALMRRPVAGFLGAWFFLLLAPSSSVVPLVTQTMAEHRMYLALAAPIAGAVVFLLGRWPGGAARIVLGVVAVGWGAVTVARNRDYRDALTLWSASVADYPRSARAHNNLALVLQQQGRHDAARDHFARALAIDPAYATGHYNAGVAMLAERRFEEAAARFETALRLAPRHVDALVNLGNALVQLRRPTEAIPYFERALGLRPAADVYYNLGVACADAGRGEAAAGHFTAALKRDPRLPEAHVQLARLQERERRATEAEAHYRSALELAPNHAAAHARLGLLCARSDRLVDAALHLREAARLTPGDADVHANLGNVLLLQGQPREALVSYETALRLRPGDARLRDSIAEAREQLR